MDCTKLPRLPGRRTSLVLIVIIFVVPLASESTDDCFSNNDYTRQELELKLGDLLVEVEEALVQNRSLLDLVMQTIFNNDRCEIDFTITVFEASAGSGLEQHLPHNVTYRCPTAVPVELSQGISWLSLLHGGIITLFTTGFQFSLNQPFSIAFTLEIRDVNFQRATIECVLSVIISWVSLALHLENSLVPRLLLLWRLKNGLTTTVDACYWPCYASVILHPHCMRVQSTRSHVGIM